MARKRVGEVPEPCDCDIMACRRRYREWEIDRAVARQCKHGHDAAGTFTPCRRCADETKP